MITMMLPSLLLAKIAGDVIDKYDSKKTMILAIAFEILLGSSQNATYRPKNVKLSLIPRCRKI